MTDSEIENYIQAKGLTAQRVTPAMIEAAIKYETYFQASDGVAGAELHAAMGNGSGEISVSMPGALRYVTLCVLILTNGTKIVGVNTGAISTANFDAELGRSLARKNAVDQMWPMLGYALRDQLLGAMEADQAPHPAVAAMQPINGDGTGGGAHPAVAGMKPADPDDFPLGKACDLSGEGGCEACQ